MMVGDKKTILLGLGYFVAIGLAFVNVWCTVVGFALVTVAAFKWDP